MSETWKEILDELDVPSTAGAGPAGAGGDWFQLTAAFGTHGFVRALTDGAEIALECAPPGDVTLARSALEDGGWEVDEEKAPFVARRAFPEETESFRPLWIAIVQIADSVRAEDAAAFVQAARSGTSAPDAVSEAEEEQLESSPDSGANEEKKPAAAFESIGTEEARPAMEKGAFAFALQASGDIVEVVLGFGSLVGPDDYGRLEQRLVRNLRGKYDVQAKVVGSHEIGVRLAREPKSRVALRVEPDGVLGQLSTADVESAVGGYFETLSELAASGIDPLVFLGVRASTRKSGAFESIGTAPAATPEPGAHSLTISDDIEEEEDRNEVVFDAQVAPSPDEPLQPGRYDDPRLKRPDATSTLVDVVLRHPGYSDRNMGQVLSILLSLDYAACLEISGRAPTTIAWGVARDRGQTMKTVIEGAGGKVVLVEPGTFEED